MALLHNFADYLILSQILFRYLSYLLVSNLDCKQIGYGRPQRRIVFYLYQCEIDLVCMATRIIQIYPFGFIYRVQETMFFLKPSYFFYHTHVLQFSLFIFFFTFQIIYNNISILFEMKQTIKTKNYNAVIQIPYQKLATKSNCYKIDNPKQNEQKFTKTIILPQCNACCQQNVKIEPNVQLSMLEDLQKAFQNDMKQKENQISQLKSQLMMAQRQLTQNKNQSQKIKLNTENQKNKFNNIINDKDKEINRLGKQLQAAQIQKEKLLRTKIAEFQNIQLQNQRNQQMKIQNLRVQQERKKQQQFNKLKVYHQQQITKLRQQLTEYRLSSEKSKSVSQKQNELITKQLLQIKAKAAQLQKQNLDYQKEIRNHIATINELNNKYTMQNNQKNDLSNKLYNLNNELSSHQILLKQSKQSISRLQNKNTQLDESYKVLFLQNNQSKAKHNQYQISILQFQQNKLKLLSQIQQLQSNLKTKQQQLKAITHPKVYQVKIQKVVDRQDYILSLETQLESIKRANLKFVDQIKNLQQIIQANQQQFKTCKINIRDLELTITKLKLYIQEKEKSFAWIVERQIAKDIQLNQKQYNKTYKVYPMEPKIYNDFKEHSPVKVRIGQNQKIIIDQSSFTDLSRKVQGENHNVAYQFASQQFIQKQPYFERHISEDIKQ